MDLGAYRKKFDVRLKASEIQEGMKGRITDHPFQDTRFVSDPDKAPVTIPVNVVGNPDLAHKVYWSPGGHALDELVDRLGGDSNFWKYPIDGHWTSKDVMSFDPATKRRVKRGAWIFIPYESQNPQIQESMKSENLQNPGLQEVTQQPKREIVSMGATTAYADDVQPRTKSEKEDWMVQSANRCFCGEEFPSFESLIYHKREKHPNTVMKGKVVR